MKLLLLIICVFVSCVSHALASVNCCLVVTCWERADLLALVGDVYCIFVTFPCCIMSQVWYLSVSFPDLCRFSYFHMYLKIKESYTCKHAHHQKVNTTDHLNDI